MTEATRTFKTILLSSAVLFCWSASADTIKIQFTGLRSGDGHLAVSLFNSENSGAFPGDADKATEQRYLKLDGQTSVEVVFNDLPEGTYAVAVMHDENSDKKFETNFLGIPKEGFGFSKNSKVYFGAPGYQKSAFNSTETPTQEIKIRYFF